MAIIQISRIQIRRGQENVTGQPILAPGEFGWAEDTNHLWIGQSITEGAPSNSNVRILTQNDLNVLPSFITTASIVASTTTVTVSSFPYNGVQSSVFINYNLYMPASSSARTGKLVLCGAVLNGVTTSTVSDAYAYLGSSNGGLTFTASINSLTSTLVLGYSGTTSTGTLSFNYTQFQ